MPGYGVSEVFDTLLLRLNIDTQPVFDGGCCCYWADAGDDYAGQCVAEIVCVEEFCEVLDCRGAGEGNAVAAARKHRAETAAIEILRQHGLIRGDYIDARSGILQRLR